jgi:hypothetical protein
VINEGRLSTEPLVGTATTQNRLMLSLHPDTVLTRLKVIYMSQHEWGKQIAKQVPPGFEPGLMEISRLRIHCDDRYTTEPSYRTASSPLFKVMGLPSLILDLPSIPFQIATLFFVMLLQGYHFTPMAHCL